MQAPIRGTLITWKQDKSFGFIRPDGGGKDVFVHHRDFGSIGRMPKVGDVVRYQRISDGTGRFRAADVQVEGCERAPPSHVRRIQPVRQKQARPHAHRSELPSPSRAWLVVVLFAGLLLGLAAFTPLPIVVTVWYLVASVVAFLMYAFDKAAAMNGRWRTSENMLLVTGLLGGWPGALVAQGMLRHKSRKMTFLVPFWMSVLVNCACLAGASTESGARAIRNLLY